jgi:hypothetical protein
MILSLRKVGIEKHFDSSYLEWGSAGVEQAHARNLNLFRDAFQQ